LAHRLHNRFHETGGPSQNGTCKVTELLDNTRFALMDLGVHAAGHAGNIAELAFAHPVISFQIFAVASILLNRMGSQVR
jgi:hypothetical protein